METSAARFQPGFCLHALFAGGRLGFLHSFFAKSILQPLEDTQESQQGCTTRGIFNKSERTPAQQDTASDVSSSLFSQMLSITCVYDLSPSPQLCLAPSVLRHGGRLQKNPHPQSKQRTMGLTPKGALIPCSFVALHKLFLLFCYVQGRAGRERGGSDTGAAPL